MLFWERGLYLPNSVNKSKCFNHLKVVFALAKHARVKC